MVNSAVPWPAPPVDLSKDTITSLGIEINDIARAIDELSRRPVSIELRFDAQDDGFLYSTRAQLAILNIIAKNEDDVYIEAIEQMMKDIESRIASLRAHIDNVQRGLRP